METKPPETIELSNKSENKLTLPLAIVVAGFLISISILFANRDKGTSNLAVADDIESKKETSNLENLLPVSPTDRILGNPNAPVKIIEFSDLECPFCKVFHTTMKTVMETAGKKGEVAWIYRHFPLESIHPKAIIEAHASECVYELGGNDKFWLYLDKIFAVTPANNGLDLNLLLKMATELGIDGAKFTECQNSDRHMATIRGQIEDGLNSGVRGTPFSIVIAPNGTKHAINGAMNLTSVMATINIAKKEVLK